MLGLCNLFCTPKETEEKEEKKKKKKAYSKVAPADEEEGRANNRANARGR